MRMLFALAAAPATLSAQTAPPPPPPPFSHVPPVVSAAPAERRVLAWMPGEVRCGGVPVAPTLWRRPALALGWSTTSRAPVTYRFRIDAAGRTLSIAPAAERSYVADGGDIMPSLAATRFSPGTERATCTVTYVTRSTALADTPVADLVSYTLDPVNGPLPAAGWSAIFVDATCDDAPKPAPLIRAYPDLDRVPGTPGVSDWTMVGYDTDAAGKPRRLRTVTGTGNAALDRAALASVARSRFTHGPRTGCRLPFGRNAAVLPAPPAPEEAGFRPATATCPATADWATRPTLTYPQNYRRRGIEGWAVVTYDVAPWGELGNLRVAAVQPAADFGDQALRVLRSARRAPSAGGHTGCVDRVIFRLAKPGEEAPAVGDTPLPPF